MQVSGFWLLVAAFSALLLSSSARDGLRSVIVASWHQWLTAVLAVGGFLLLGHVLNYSGMTSALAQSVSSLSGVYYAAFAPVLGALGGFLTASNASSNGLFMEFQVAAAKQLSVPIELAAAVQNAAGSNATLASPGRVVFAAGIVGGKNAESELLRRVLPVAVGGLVATSLLAMLFYVLL